MFRKTIFAFASLLAGCTQLVNAATGQTGGEEIRVMNSTSVAICSVTVGVGAPAPDGSDSYADRRANKMQEIDPGATASVVLPTRKADGKQATYDVKAFACDRMSSKAGPMVAEIQNLDPNAQGPFVLR